MNEIFGLSFSQLQNNLERAGFSGYRAEQIFNWLYENRVLRPDRMENLPEELQDYLRENFKSCLLSFSEISASEDGTRKYLADTSDELQIESVLLPRERDKKYTACVSTQIGCSLGCSFCASGISGLERNLSAGEIVAQIFYMNRHIYETEKSSAGNIVYMGMGEPFMNYSALKKSIKILIDERGFNFARRRITVSTAGVVPGIKKIAADFPQVGLAVSLHSAEDSLRSRIMPVNKKYNLSSLKEALVDYQRITSRRITLEYVLLPEINDSRRQAEMLVDYTQNLDCHINLISANPVPELNVKSASIYSLEKFKTYLNRAGLSVTIRKSRGRQKKAACGQLRHRRGDS